MLLLERFYDPTEGQIVVDGINLKDINVSHLRSSIGYVGQASLMSRDDRDKIC